MKEDKEKLQAQLKEKIDKEFSRLDGIEKMLKSVLENFAYRYIATEVSGDVKAVKSGDHSFTVEALEKNMKLALKCSNKDIYRGIVKLLQQVPLKQGPAVKYQIMVRLTHEKGGKRGKGEISARVNWDYPHFAKSTERLFERREAFIFEDFLELRNTYPLALEKACEIF
ncbi:MAG: hypothetical protein OXB84_07450 [Halobacteriovoraceae bacterium]|nr:hypothetical protein [Halobacteriovoraceae bacterium]